MKYRNRERIKKLEQIVDPEPFLSPVIIYDPKKPRPERPLGREVVFYIPDNGRKERPRLSEEDRKKIELIVQQRETETIEKNKLSD